jgi:phosphatidylserine decarboxylase
MDPFAVISFGKKIFRTRVIRHSLNPIWDEKMLFHVRRYEKLFKIQFAILDWDKLTSNDHVGDAVLELGELMSSVPKPDEETGIYPEGVESAHGMQEFKLRLVTGKEAPWESKHTPFITIR